MSYQVLARKWRPRSFDEMVGQEHVLKALVNGLDNGRLHHAYLFTGTRGVGKTTLARIIAKCLNCEHGVSSSPCGECGACVAIAEGRFVDLLEVDAASRTKVEDTRDLLDNVQYLPTGGRYKVYLIDEVHMLSTHSFNALLKTLEEPPPHVKFLLATTDPQKLPVTVLSRCLQFNLKNLGPERIVSHLKFVLGEEKVPFEEDALWALGRAADGSMRDALSLTDQAIAHGGGLITQAEVSSMLGTIDRAGVVEICEAVARADAGAALAAVQQLADHAPDYSEALGEMLSFWHRIAIAQTAPDALDHSHADHHQVLQLAAALDRETVQLLYQITLLGRRDLPHAADPRSGFEMVLMRLLAFHPVMPESLADQPMPSRPLAAPETPPAKKPDAESLPATPVGGSSVPPVTKTAPAASAPAVSSPAESPAVGQLPTAGSTAATSTAADAPTALSHAGASAASGHSPSASLQGAAAAPAPGALETQAHEFAKAKAVDRAPWEDPPQSDGRAPSVTATPATVIATPARAIATPTRAIATPADESTAGETAAHHLSLVPPSPAGASAALEDAERPPWEEYEAALESRSRADHDIESEVARSAQLQTAKEQAGSAGRVNIVPDAPAPLPDQARDLPALPVGERPAPLALTALTSGNWLDVYLGLEVGGLLQSIAANLYLDSTADAKLAFTLDRANSSLYREEHQGRLAELLSSYFAENVQVVITLGEPAGETPRQVLQRRRAERLQQAVDSLRQDPLVRTLLEHTAGELLEHSVRPLD